ncbi:hypothetical protein C1T17_08550 [Sphingobium sp. SCG-1]|uniref:DUF3617 domain-containing protein n=1 Tax=Sphingobium sp. SCG-1 TaxID=2072936 RepID=UPI000CD69BC8|nr:DUF3617 domain-containing protein [Sphingobium sp. SCG-1]AUW58150.1 hypothetical protein C1T17_08550 [Sphingobium sp. SCG-1]
MVARNGPRNGCAATRETAGMKAAILVFGAALLLTGCGKNDKAATGPMTAEQVASKMDEVKLEPGEWEATQEILDVQMTGLPKDAPANAMKQMVGQKNTVKHCITPEQAAKPGADFLAAQKDAKCAYANMDMNNGIISGTMTCSAPNNPKAVMKMMLKGTYQPTSYAMAMEMQSEGMGGGMGMTMKIKSEGKRIGDCPAGAATTPKAGD